MCVGGGGGGGGGGAAGCSCSPENLTSIGSTLFKM